MQTKLVKLKGGASLLVTQVKGIEGITITLKFDAGAVNDPAKKLGLAHFCEHAICNFSTRHDTREEKSKKRKSLLYTNASTGMHCMRFYLDTVRSRVEKDMSFLMSTFDHILYTKEDFEKEKGVILDEIKTRKKTNPRKMYYFFLTHILKEKAVKHVTSSFAGTEQTVMNIKLDDLEKFISKYVTLNNLTIYMVGNISPARAKKLVENYVYKVLPISTTFGIKEKDLSGKIYTKYFWVPAEEKGKCMLHILYPLPDTIDKKLELEKMIQRHIVSNILHKKAYTFFRIQKGLCYGVQCGCLRWFDQYYLEFLMEIQEENLDTVLACYPEFLAQLEKDISQEEFATEIGLYFDSYNYDVDGIHSILKKVQSNFKNYGWLYGTKMIKEDAKMMKNMTKEDVDQWYHQCFVKKPTITIMSNDEKYEKFDVKSFYKNIQQAKQEKENSME